MTQHTCPCGKGSYAECCEPLHLGTAKALTAEQLMRSRYSAFALQQIDYIVKTTALGQQTALDKDAIADWSKQNQWLGLEVVNAKEKLGKTHAQVEFKAHYHDGQKAQVHHEVSHFVFHQQQWFFLDPTVDMHVTMKQPCICGSGKKFKQCCAQFI
ncbi:preprotein translocase subunit SecA [Acinetobacter calcoaceticus]|uniref:Preprotein translocase subunit SecA n=1 Tax=Acinetobacter oleivorans TaxID=1148157 RepID=A0A0B2UB95_9GAMM|nr:YchJ family protein [Acinetobacter calcoaceticus]KHN68276.1 preprotein translocase subunit SecA [Acinetobacter oleivorans]KUM13274.1 preprotein translocase subunit SecA [Acinetobacter calcoaceticus]